MSETETVRPTKKQRDLLTYIEEFIAEHGYSPSYREIMNGLHYTSVATVSLHVNSLIKRGHLRKRDRSARSLEVVSSASPAAAHPDPAAAPAQTDGQHWLIERIEQKFAAAEHGGDAAGMTHHDLAALVQSLHLLGLPEAATGFAARLHELQLRELSQSAEASREAA